MESDPRLRGAYGSPDAAAAAAAAPVHPGVSDRPGGATAQAYEAEHAEDDRPSSALRDAAWRIGELKEYASYYVAAKLDSYKISARNLVMYGALGLLGAVAGATFVVMATVLLLLGISEAISALCGWLFGPGWMWIGPLLVGLLVLGVLAAGVIFGLKWLTKTSHKRMVNKYEDRQRRQRAAYGHDVEERAKAAERREERPATGAGRAAR